MNRSIVFVITSLGLGGAETQLQDLALRFKGRGWRVTAVSMIPAEESRAAVLRQAGVTVESLNMKPGAASFAAMRELAAIIRRENPQVVHAHMVHANLLARLTRLLVRMPLLISTAHNINEGARWRELAYRLTDPLTDLTTQVSVAGLERYAEVGAVPRGRMIFMPNGVDTARFRPNLEARAAKRAELGLRSLGSPEDEFMWIAVGRFAEAKDYPNLLRAFAQVAQDQPNARLFVAGKGDLFEPMKQLVAELGLAGSVNLLGPRSDVSALMNAADGYVMSSAWEGMPMVLLEAAAIGLPIVTTDVGGNREAFEEGKSGYLVPAKDSAALANGMLELMRQTPEVRAEMGKAARRFIVEKYDLETVVTQWEQLYAKLLNKRAVQGS
ncbi:MAG: glycosyltransferase [Meiothermus sp.]|nr:glycosyltransferase [Meiothermus sp.]